MGTELRGVSKLRRLTELSFFIIFRILVGLGPSWDHIRNQKKNLVLIGTKTLSKFFLKWFTPYLRVKIMKFSVQNCRARTDDQKPNLVAASCFKTMFDPNLMMAQGARSININKNMPAKRNFSFWWIYQNLTLTLISK